MGKNRPLGLGGGVLSGQAHPDHRAAFGRPGGLQGKYGGQHGVLGPDGRYGEQLGKVPPMEFAGRLAGEGRFRSQDGVPEKGLLRQPVPLQVVRLRERGRIGIRQAEIEGPVPPRPVPAPFARIADDVLAAQEVEGVFQVDFPNGVVVRDGGDFVVRNPLRHPVAAAHDGADPPFVTVGNQIGSSRILVPVPFHHRPDDVDGLAGAAGVLDGGGADFIDQAAGGLVLAGTAHVRCDADPVFVYIAVAGLGAGELEPEIGQAVRGGRNIVDVQHLLAALVLVVAQIYVTVCGRVLSGDDAEAQEGEEEGLHGRLLKGDGDDVQVLVAGRGAH